MATPDNSKVRTLIDRWLGRVEAHLADRQSGEREDLLRDLEAHVHDALASRTEEISGDDVETVLAEMDDPSSYGAPLPRPTAPTAPPPPPLSTGSTPSLLPYWIALGVAVIGIVIPVLASAIAGNDGYGFSRAERLGFFTLHALLLLASIIAAATWWRRMDDRGPDATLRRLAALAFMLLVASVVAPLIGFGVGQLLTVRSYAYGYGGNYHEIYEANRTAQSLFLLFVFTGIAAAVLSYLVGRVALWPRSGDGPALSGWPRAQAAVTPFLVSLGLILAFLVAGVALVVAGMHDGFRFRPRGNVGMFAMIGIGALGLALWLGIGALLVRFATGMMRFVCCPLADGLEPRHARRVLILASIAALLGAACFLPYAISG
jgi:HAAS